MMENKIIKVGDKAPLFSLPSSDTSTIQLTDYSGQNVLLLFFPFAFTGVCTKELCYFRDELSRYEKLGVQILAVSVDSPFTLAEFKRQNNYSFPLLSDFNKEVSQSYGALHDVFALNLRKVSKRSAFIIDKNGIIRYAEVLEIPKDEPNYNSIQNILEKLYIYG